MSSIKPKIYVACLAAYNNGYLHGAWIDANQDVDELFAAVQTILASSPIPHAEEWEIHDYEGFGGTYLREYSSLEKVSALACFIEEYDELGAAILDYTYGDVDQARHYMEDCYYGEYSSEKDFAISFAEDTMDIPDHLQYYIDYEQIAYDLFITDFFSVEVNYKTHVFSQC